MVPQPEKRSEVSVPIFPNFTHQLSVTRVITERAKLFRSVEESSTARAKSRLALTQIISNARWESVVTAATGVSVHLGKSIGISRIYQALELANKVAWELL